MQPCISVDSVDTYHDRWYVAAALSAVVTVTLAWRPAHGTVRLAVEPKYDARVRPAPHHHHCTVTANAAFASSLHSTDSCSKLRLHVTQLHCIVRGLISECKGETLDTKIFASPYKSLSTDSSEYES